MSASRYAIAVNMEIIVYERDTKMTQNPGVIFVLHGIKMYFFQYAIYNIFGGEFITALSQDGRWEAVGICIFSVRRSM